MSGITWGTVGKAIEAVAPTLAGILAGPEAGVAVGAGLAALLGTQHDPAAVLHAIQNDPTALLKIKQLEVDFAKAKLAAQSQAVAQAAQNVRVGLTSKSWIERDWRGLLMLTIVAIIANNYLIAPYVNDLFPHAAAMLQIPTQLWNLMQIGVGGYVLTEGGAHVANNWPGQSKP